MEHKKDIGTLFKEKLQNKTKNPKSGLWEKIDASLTQRERKRKQAYWSWGVATSVLIIAGIIFSLTFLENNKEPKQPNSLAIPVQNDIENNKKRVTSKVDSVGKKFLKNSADSISENAKNLNKTTVNTSNKKQKNSKLELVEKGFDSFKKKTVYRYYNSQNSTTIETTDKAFIDSLVTLDKTEVKIDSIN